MLSEKLKNMYLLKQLKDKLLKNRDIKKWFIETYLPQKNYFTIMNQINGNAGLQPDTKKAIEKYLSE